MTGADFDAAAKTLTTRVDFVAGSRFALVGSDGQHQDTVIWRYWHLASFRYECFLEVRVLRVKLPDGGVRQVDPP